MAIDVERLSWLLQAVILESTPSRLPMRNATCMESISAEVAEDPDVVWSPMPD